MEIIYSSYGLLDFKTEKVNLGVDISVIKILPISGIESEATSKLVFKKKQCKSMSRTFFDSYLFLCNVQARTLIYP